MSNKLATTEDFCANATMIEALWKTLDHTDDLDSPIAVEIRKRLTLLVADHARLLGMPESTIAELNAREETIIAEIKTEKGAIGRQETEMLRWHILQIRRFINTLERES